MDLTVLGDKIKTFFETGNNLVIVIAIAVAVAALIVIIAVSAPKRKKKKNEKKAAEIALNEAVADAPDNTLTAEKSGAEAANQDDKPKAGVAVADAPVNTLTAEKSGAEAANQDEKPKAGAATADARVQAAEKSDAKPAVKPDAKPAVKPDAKAAVKPKEKIADPSDKKAGEPAKKETAKVEKNKTGKAGANPAEPADAVKAEPATKKTAAAKKVASAKEEVAAGSAAMLEEDYDEAELTEDEGKEGRPGTVEIYKDSRGEFHFRFRAMNGSIVGHSQAYKSKDGCKNGIRSVEATSAEAIIADLTKKDGDYVQTIGQAAFEIYRDTAGQFRYRLVAKNASNILASQGYTNKTNCLKGAESIIRMAKNHTVADLTLKRKPKDAE